MVLSAVFGYLITFLVKLVTQERVNVCVDWDENIDAPPLRLPSSAATKPHDQGPLYVMSS